MRKKIFFKYIIKCLILLILSLILGIFINSTVENVSIQVEISKFTKKGIYQEEISTDDMKFYKVSRETWQPDIPSFTIYNNKMYYGNSGDIIVGLESAIKGYPIISDTITYFIGGHASLVCYEYELNGIKLDNTYNIEASLVESSNVKFVRGDFWNDPNYRTEVIGLRVKASEEKKKEAFLNAVNCLGKKYNDTYIFNTKNRYYCSDLISRCYEKVGIELNYDGFYTSIQDLIFNKNVYITFYKKIKNGISYIYYLE